MRRLAFAVDIDGTVTEDGGGRVHLGALGALRGLAAAGHDVVYVTGRSSVEGYLLAVFGGTTQAAVGENGGCLTLGASEHVLLGDMARCREALGAIRSRVEGVREKPVFPRMTEVVLERTFDLGEAREALSGGPEASLSDSGYAYHINSPGVDKGSGFSELMRRRSISPEDVVAIGDSATDVPLFRVAGTSVALGNAPDGVAAEATMEVPAGAGDGVLEALDKLAPRFPGL